MSSDEERPNSNPDDTTLFVMGINQIAVGTETVTVSIQMTGTGRVSALIEADEPKLTQSQKARLDEFELSCKTSLAQEGRPGQQTQFLESDKYKVIREVFLLALEVDATRPAEVGSAEDLAGSTHSELEDEEAGKGEGIDTPEPASNDPDHSD